MKKKTIRTLAMLLCVLMCMTMVPLTALAAAPEELEAAEIVPAAKFAGKAAGTAKLAAVTNGKPKITTQPKSRSVMQGKTITLKVAAKGSGLKYQWYFRKKASGSWKKVSGGTTASLKITVGRYNGYQYRCKVSNKSGSVTSKAATLTVNYITYRALLVCQNYTNVTSLNTLYGDNDLAYMGDLLSKTKGPKGGKYDITYVKDASKSLINFAIDYVFGEADSNDVSLFYFTGHGDSSSYGSAAGALCTVEGTSYSLLQLGTLAGWLKNVKGKVIVMIDSCGSGAAVYKNGELVSDPKYEPVAFNQAVINAFAAADETITDDTSLASNTGEMRSSKFVVLTASKYQENSSYHSASGTPVSHFTYWLWYGGVPYGSSGRKMDADANNNHIVTVYEMYKFIKKYDSYDYYTQHVQMYSSSKSYPLFKS